MTDMDKMNEALAKFLHEVEMPDGGIAEEAFVRGWSAAQASHHAETLYAQARAAINPDDRLREALDNERGAKQLYKDFENTTDEHVELVFSANACPEHKALADEMREWFRAAVDAALSPLPQGDGYGT